MKVHVRKQEGKKGDSLYLDYYFNGKRVREFLNIHIKGREDRTEKMLLAKKIASQREIEIAGGDYNYIPSHKKKIDFIDYFRSYIKKSTRKNTRMLDATLNHLIKYSDSVLLSTRIDEKFCMGFKLHLQTHLNGETPFDYFKIFRSVISEAVQDGVFSKNPAANIKNNYRGNNILSKEVLSDSELKILFKTRCGSSELKRAFLFACFTGLRAVDIRELRYSNIDFRNRFLKLSQSKTGVGVHPPLNAAAISLLGKPKKANDLIFKLPSHAAMNKTLKNWVQRAKIKKHITFHCARHTFGTSLLVHGADLKTTSELLGHTSTKQTEKYTHISNKMKRSAVDLISLPFSEARSFVSDGSKNKGSGQ